MVPNNGAALADGKKRRWLLRLGVQAARWEEVPRRLRGRGLGICNTWWLTDGRAIKAKQRGWPALYRLMA